MKFIFQIIFLLMSIGIYSQSIIEGKISNLDKNVIGTANVILKDVNGETMSFSFSNELGFYKLTVPEIGNFSVVVNSLGYQQQEKIIQIKKSNEKLDIDFELEPKIFEINEVIIEKEKPIVLKKDTLVFDAKSFLQGNEEVVEDLLKKIPGINIDETGTIKVGNQEVEKIMIEGDDFFDKGYKLLSKNMPVYPIDKVELYQNYSNNKHLKGIENSQKVALNLTLKENAKHIWFGNFSTGLGLFSENRYEMKGNLMSFGKKNKHYFLANLNNNGFDATGDLDYLIRPMRVGEPGNIGDDQSADKLLGLGFESPNLKQNRINFNNAEVLSLNSIFTLSSKIKLKSLGFLNSDENDFFRDSFQYFSVGNTTFENTENFVGRKKQLTGLGKLDLVYDISNTQSLEYTGKFNNTVEKANSKLYFNDELLNENLKSDNQLFDQKLVFTNNFKENKVFLLSARFIHEKTPQNYTVNQFVFEELFAEKASNTKQFSENKMYFTGLEGHLLNKMKNGDLLEIKFGNQWRKDYLNSTFELFDTSNTVALPSNFQNYTSYSTNDLSLSTKYHLSLGKYTLSGQSDFHQLSNQLRRDDIKTNQSSLYIIPKIGFEWKINDKNNITASYSYNTTNATILDIYSGYIQTGFRSFLKGSEGFNQLNSSNTFLNYTYGNWGDKFFSNVFILYTKNNDFYSTNSTISQNYSLVDKFLIKDRNFLSFSSSIDYYYKPVRSNLKILFGASKSDFKNSVNNSYLREVTNLNLNFGFELRSSFKGFINYHLSSKWNTIRVKSTFENSFTNNESSLDLLFNLNKKLNFQLQSERYYFGNLEKENNQYYFVDLEAKYVVKENQLTLFLSGNNLFNTKKFKNYSISDINISQTEFRLVQRYVLLKVEYRF